MGVPKNLLLNTGPTGLTEDEAERRLQKFGKNQLEEKKDNPLLKLVMSFLSPMAIMILLPLRLRPSSRTGLTSSSS
jgi:magnesium-transporting ATPase (P-type)